MSTIFTKITLLMITTKQLFRQSEFKSFIFLNHTTEFIMNIKIFPRLDTLDNQAMHSDTI